MAMKQDDRQYKSMQKVHLDVRSMLCHVCLKHTPECAYLKFLRYGVRLRTEMVFCHQVHLDKTVTLLDSPGIVFSTGKGDAAAALRNCLKVRNPSALVVLSTPQHIIRRAPACHRHNAYGV